MIAVLSRMILYFVGFKTLSLFARLFISGEIEEKSVLEKFKNKMNITRDITLIITKSDSISYGDIYSLFTPCIVLSKEDRLSFIIYHELAHIKQCHQTKTFVMFSILLGMQISIISMIFLYCVRTLSSLYFENEADRIACEYCTKDEIIQAISFLNQKEDYKESLFNHHPTIKSRLIKLKHYIRDNLKN